MLVSWFLSSTLAAQAVRLQKISAIEGGFKGALLDGGRLGSQVVSLGDLDGDGITELAVSAPGQPENAFVGAVWILFLNRDGTVRDQRRLDIGDPNPGSLLGIGLGALGDYFGDGIPDIQVSSTEKLYLLSLDGRGSVSGPRDGASWPTSLRWSVFSQPDDLWVIGEPHGDLGGAVQLWLNGVGTILYVGAGLTDMQGEFGHAHAGLYLGAEPALAVGAPTAPSLGAIFLLQFDPIRTGTELTGATLRQGTVRIDPVRSSLPGVDLGDMFGAALGNVGDLNADGQDDLVVGAPNDDDGGPNRGAVWILFLDQDGSVKWHDKLSSDTRPELSVLADRSWFGSSVASLGDLDGDGFPEVAVGAPGDNDGGPERGAVFVLSNLNDTRPGIALPTAASSPAMTETPLDVTARVISPLSGPPEVNLVFNRGGDLDEFSVLMQEDSPGVFSGRIPSFAVGERGVEYFVTARSSTGLESRSPEHGTYSNRVLLPDGLQISVPGVVLLTDTVLFPSHWI